MDYLNKKGGAVLFMIFASIVYFIFGMVTYRLLKPQIDSTHSDLVCTSPDTAGDIITCLTIDGIIPAVVIMILSTAGGIITAKL